MLITTQMDQPVFSSIFSVDLSELFAPPPPPPYAEVIYCLGGGCSHSGLVISPHYVYYIDIFPTPQPPCCESTPPPWVPPEVIDPPTSVPEPGTLVLMVAGVLAILATQYRRFAR